MKSLYSILLLLLTCNLFSLDLNTYFLINNFNFNSDNEIVSTDYQIEYGEIVSQEISNGLFLDAGFTKSIISDYSIFTDFRISNDLFGFNLGIFTNFLNDSSKILTPGLNYGLDFLLPGYFLINLDLNNTIPNTSALESGVSINNYNIKLGFYIGDTIISGNLKSEYNTKGNILTSTSTSNNKYFLNLDLFNKYSKYRISIDLGWNEINRKVTSLTTESDILVEVSSIDKQAGSAFFNTQFTLLIFDSLNIDLGLLLHLYKFPLKDVDSFQTDEFSWGMNLSVNYRI